MFFKNQIPLELEKRFKLPLEIIQSNRRNTISIQIAEHSVIVRAPSWCKQIEIDKFINKNDAWIVNKILKLK